MFECPNCGGNLKFDIPSQQLACEHCHTKMDPYSFENKTKDAEEQTYDDGYYEVTIFTCPQCGGEILSTDNTAAAFCSFCGASTILYSHISNEKRPNYIIPFKKTKEDCKQAYSDMMKRAIFAPKELKDPQYIDGFRGIYMPYWAFYITQKGPISLRGKQEHRRGDYIVTDYFSLQGDMDAYYKGLSYDASSSFSDNISEAIAPYDVKGMKAFTPAYLSGFYADTADVETSVYQTEAEMITYEESMKKISNIPAFKPYTITQGIGAESSPTSIHTKTETVDQSMFPVWFMSYRNGDRVAYATVNGQTGKVVTDLPVDMKKYLLGSLLLAIPLFLILNLFFTVIPSNLLTVTAIIALIATIISTREIRNIVKKEAGEDDRGLLSKTDPEKLKELDHKRKPKTAKNKPMQTFLSCLYIILALTFFLPMIIEILAIFFFSTDGLNAFLPDFMSHYRFSIVWLIIVIAALVISIPGFRKLDKVPGQTGLLGMIMALIGIIIGAVVTFLNPASDLFFYGAASLSLIAVFFTVTDIIRQYNILSTRKLPQFDRQGGDDRA